MKRLAACAAGLLALMAAAGYDADPAPPASKVVASDHPLKAG